MTRKMILLAASFAMTSSLAMTSMAQNKKAEKIGQKADQKVERRADQIATNDKVTITIQSVTKNDAGAKKNADGKSRNVPVSFQWLCGSQGKAILAELIAELVTLNTDGTQTNVSKRLADWSVNRPITSVIDLPMPEGVFAKSFTLKLVGKFKNGIADQLVPVSAVKSGTFPLVGK